MHPADFLSNLAHGAKMITANPEEQSSQALSSGGICVFFEVYLDLLSSTSQSFSVIECQFNLFFVISNRITLCDLQ